MTCSEEKNKRGRGRLDESDSLASDSLTAWPELLPLFAQADQPLPFLLSRKFFLPKAQP